MKIVYCQGDMFRPSLGHLQALKENRSKVTWITYIWDRTMRFYKKMKYAILDLFSLRA